MTGTRYRLVTVQGGREHVSSVVLGAGEVSETLDLEESMHAAAGWGVRRVAGSLLCVRGMTVRRMFVRAYGPLDDLTDAAGVAPSPRPGRSTLEER